MEPATQKPNDNPEFDADACRVGNNQWSVHVCLCLYQASEKTEENLEMSKLGQGREDLSKLHIETFRLTEELQNTRPLH